jgi:hypothetical protein
MNYIKADFETRRELFKKYYYWSLKTQDCDPAMFMMNYVNSRMELNIEQRYWFAWLYANTYNVATAWILFNEFPDFENVDESRLAQWNTDNYRRLRYQTDNKWQKGHLPAMFTSYKKWVYSGGVTSQFEAFDCLCLSTPKENFIACQNSIVKHMYKFGRYLGWFYLQTLRETCDLNVDANSLLLQDSSSESHRNGLLYALGMDVVVEEKMKVDKEMYAMLDEQVNDLLVEMNHEHPDVEAELFSMETTLCAFKKVFRDKHGRYLGYYLDRQAEDISKCEDDGWNGIDWQLLWDARKECIDPKLLDNKVDTSKMGELMRTGKIERLEWFDSPFY